ncbi:glycoside hydrolase family 30 beta sandwich domain-containing protein [Algoriphagus sp.]|uniref:glycoside hydrolase family 30 protein n=1 Tax=Algoriphagus sp. TaxID=1872435 RepID=UPI002718E750|nr:glycoside hydrolase family 30 beta sandwich domain-containing protein [Algoriphagus sp.]MDO8967184.1 glycoside hydrolase family 30 beta sandwich domain-containing protein [Algoriphagus sp.]MDP3199717.1 glycoside hydrolase family 30 beta sandwich domain-containing protein [Algoriphagus sp.]
MKKILSVLVLLSCISCGKKNRPQVIEHWLTDPVANVLFEKQEDVDKTNESELVIAVDAETSFQSMDGFGFTLSQGSAKHLLGMGEAARAALLKELFGNGEKDIRISYLRLSVAASDLNDFPFSYNDLEDSLATDSTLTQFSLGPDTLDVLPVLKQILKINPNIKLMASPWSPPKWMKDNKDTRGGSLLEEFEGIYACYLVQYIKAMKEKGFEIDALTIQNEPLHPGNNPSLLMFADQQARFIGVHLGPAFAENGIKTKILIYDHNADRPDYPIAVLNDSLANPFIDGSAFHLYAGEIAALSRVHQAYPDKNIYFTEQWIGAPGNLEGDMPWHVKNLIIGATRNWAKTVLEWNLTSNPELTPFTDRGGCDRCLGAVTVDGDSVTRNPAYYVIAHASKFVDPGSVRIDSNLFEGLHNVAFLRPDGKKVLIALNDAKKPISFQVKDKGKTFFAELNPGATGTWIW